MSNAACAADMRQNNPAESVRHINTCFIWIPALRYDGTDNSNVHGRFLPFFSANSMDSMRSTEHQGRAFA